MSSSPSMTPEDLFLALCFDPKGVDARNAALDGAIALLAATRQVLYDSLPEGEPDPDSPVPDDADARIPFAVTLVAQVALSLIDGIRTLLPSNIYSANALVRQLVEVEYLAWACANDSEDAIDWLMSDRKARRERWSPQRLRDRAGGRFDAEEYKSHCEAGGHPTPAGILTLNGPTKQHPQLAIMPEATLYEATLHALAICDYLLHAVPSFALSAYVSPESAHDLLSTWKRDDPACEWSATRGSGHEDELYVAATLAAGAARLLDRLDP